VTDRTKIKIVGRFVVNISPALVSVDARIVATVEVVYMVMFFFD